MTKRQMELIPLPKRSIGDNVYFMYHNKKEKRVESRESHIINIRLTICERLEEYDDESLINGDGVYYSYLLAIEDEYENWKRKKKGKSLKSKHLWVLEGDTSDTPRGLIDGFIEGDGLSIYYAAGK